jgi:hypothetical protein
MCSSTVDWRFGSLLPISGRGGFTGPNNATPRDTGAVVTHTFVATGTELIVVLDGRGVTDPTMADHNAIVNGSTLELEEDAADSDGDSLWDAWENQLFGNLAQTGTGDADSDGLANNLEYTPGHRTRRSPTATTTASATARRSIQPTAIRRASTQTTTGSAMVKR